MRGARGRHLATIVVLLAIGGGIAGTSGEAAQRPRVAVVLEAGEGCPPPGTLPICEGVRRAVRATGVTARIVAPTFREDVVDFLGLIARQGYAAVVLFGYQYRPELGAVASRHPDVGFVVMDASRTDVPGAPRNVQGVVLQTREAAFVAGWLAAKLELRRPGHDVVGAVGGVRIRGVTDFVHGFVAGARRAAPRSTVLVDYANDFLDPAKCAGLARRQIARGAGAVFNVAGSCGLGTMNAAADAGVWAVGVDTDQSHLGPHVLTSVLKNYESGFTEVLRQVKAGRVRGGRDTVLTIRDGAAGLGRISPKVPRQLVRQLEALRRSIVSGKTRVPQPGASG